jgi:L-fucose isomerase-like protein
MRHHSSVKLTNPISGQVSEASIIGDPERTYGGDHYRADVYITIHCGASFSVTMTPQEARQLAQHLTAAADVAEPVTTAPKAAPLTLVEAVA